MYEIFSSKKNKFKIKSIEKLISDFFIKKKKKNETVNSHQFNYRSGFFSFDRNRLDFKRFDSDP